MFRRNYFFCLAIFFVIAQQVVLAGSTYYIALAGASLVDVGSGQAIKYVMYFFLLALGAYLLSSISSLCSVKASNQIWRDYTDQVIEKTTKDLGYSSANNKKNIVQWVNGEASSTIPQATQFYIGYLSVVLNIILTLAVFYLSVGFFFTFVISLALGLSTFFVMLLRKKINSLAGEMQTKRLSMLVTVESVWDRVAYGHDRLKEEGFGDLSLKSSGYFSLVERYTLLEQAVACLPVVVAVLAIVGVLYIPEFYPAAMVGTLVAILPRSLQLLGSIHSLSIYSSQYYLFKAKVKNLIGFVEALCWFDLSSNIHDISVIDSLANEQISADKLKSGILSGEISKGRYRVIGRNGSGKSTFLKVIKDLTADSLLLIPEVIFLNSLEEKSTGQNRVEQLISIIAAPPHILMLDEWDANLDSENTRVIDDMLDCLKEKSLVIETRHKVCLS